MSKRRWKRRNRPAMEGLETRDLPATWGIPWADPQHLTISFAPDGTNALGQSSTLFHQLNGQLGTGTWESTILRAVQTWASEGDINVGLVSDGGEPIGTAGPAQGDPRFGDIRISAAPLSPGVVAIGTPYDPSTGTLSGDIIINSNADFNPSDPGSYDLYSVVLHEAGHVFGFADSSDPSSFMYNVYQGPVTGLAPGAVPALQALYGAPVADASEIGPGNPQNSTPGQLQNSNSNQPGVASAAAALSSSQDADVFRFQPQAGVSYAAGLDVRVQTQGISLLAPTLTVTNASGQVLATSSAGPLAGGVSLHLDGIASNATYYIDVSGSADVFGVGAFQLTASATNAGNPVVGGQHVAATALSSQLVARVAARVGGGRRHDLAEQHVGLLLLHDPAPDAPGRLRVAADVGRRHRPAQGHGLRRLDARRRAGRPFGDVGRRQLQRRDPQAALEVLRRGGRCPDDGLRHRGLCTPGRLHGPVGAGDQSPGRRGRQRREPDPGAVEQRGPSDPDPRRSGRRQPGGLRPHVLDPPGRLSGAAAERARGTTQEMTVSVVTLDSEGVTPVVNVYDSKGNPVAAQVLAAEGGAFVVQVACSPAVSSYLIQVKGGAVGLTTWTGAYYLDATFGTAAASPATIASGRPTASGLTASLEVDTEELFHFVATAGAGDASDGRAGDDQGFRAATSSPRWPSTRASRRASRSCWRRAATRSPSRRSSRSSTSTRRRRSCWSGWTSATRSRRTRRAPARRARRDAAMIAGPRGGRPVELRPAMG